MAYRMDLIMSKYFDWENELVEVRFPLIEKNNVMEPADNFLKVKETLTRIGAPGYEYDENDKQVRVLWQSCHILSKRQRYFVCHFKEMHLLDRKFDKTELTENDLARRNAIALLLQEWKLVEIVNPNKVQTPKPVPISTLKIISFKDKNNWILDAKYDVGNPRNRY